MIVDCLEKMIRKIDPLATDEQIAKKLKVLTDVHTSIIAVIVEKSYES